MTASRDFSYSPLDLDADSFRLLVLAPGNGDDSIICRLENASFKEARGNEQLRPYEALSYTWGVVGDTVAIEVDGAQMDIRPNLYDALQHLRRPDNPRVLWIDAICINQHNVSERNHQVKQMTSIYSRADQVIVWLGTTTPDSEGAMHLLGGLRVPGNSASNHLFTPEVWKILLSFVENEYWQRVWIVQEVCLAKELRVVWGLDEISWEDISELFWWLGDPEFYPLLPEEKRAIKSSMLERIHRQRLTYRNRSCSLHRLLDDFSESLCQLPHDKVYGFLGLISRYHAQEFSVDYAKPLLQLHADVMEFYLRYEGTEDFPPPVFYIGCLVSQSLGLCEIKIEAFHHLRDLRLNSPRRRISIEARYLGSITALAPIDPPSTSGSSNNHENKWLEDAMPLDAYIQYEQFKRGFIVVDFLVETAIRAENNAFPVGRPLRIGVSESLATNIKLDTSNKSSIEDAEPQVSEGVAYRARLYPHQRGASGRKFWSSSGYLGIVPENAGIGDSLFRLPGSDISIAARFEGSRIQVIGTAFIEPSPIIERLAEGYFPLESRASARIRQERRVQLELEMEIFQLLATEARLFFEDSESDA